MNSTATGGTPRRSGHHWRGAVWGAPGPHGLYAPGVIDLVLVAANAGALAATATARVA